MGIRALSLKEFLTVKSYLSDSISLMDESGKKNRTGNSIVLWEHEWKELRDNLFLAWEILDENWDGSLPDDCSDEAIEEQYE
jgi:hypothetical protein